MRVDEVLEIRIGVAFDDRYRVEPNDPGATAPEEWIGSEHLTIDGALKRVRSLLEARSERIRQNSRR